MPVRILADGFFDAEDVPSEAPHPPSQFRVCAEAAAVQGAWFRAVIIDAAGRDGETFAVVYLGAPEASLDNDRMAALRGVLPAVFPGDTLVIADSPEQGRVELHGELSGETLLLRAAVVGVIQAAALWDDTSPLRVTNAHRVVECRPSFDPSSELWTSVVERHGP